MLIVNFNPFPQLSSRREAKVDPGNASSLRLLERNHFVREGFFKEDYFYNGNFFNTAVYSLLNPHYNIMQ